MDFTLVDLLGMIVIHLLRDVVFHLNLGCKKKLLNQGCKKPCKLFNGINFHTHADQHYHHPIIDHFRHFPLAHTGSRARRKWLHRFRMRRVCTPHAMRSLMKKQRCWKFNHVLVVAKVAWGTKKLPRVLIFFLGFKVNSLNYATVVELGKPRFGGLIRSFLLAIYVLSIYIYCCAWCFVLD